MTRNTTGSGMPFLSSTSKNCPYDFYLKGDINHVSDRFYPRDFDQDLPENTQIDARSLNQLTVGPLRRKELGSVLSFDRWGDV